MLGVLRYQGRKDDDIIFYVSPIILIQRGPCFKLETRVINLYVLTTMFGQWLLMQNTRLSQENNSGKAAWIWSGSLEEKKAINWRVVVWCPAKFCVIRFRSWVWRELCASRSKRKSYKGRHILELEYSPIFPRPVWRSWLDLWEIKVNGLKT